MAELTPMQKAVEMFMQGSTPKEVSDNLNIPEGTAKTWKTRYHKPSQSIAELETEIQELNLAVEKSETEIQKLKLKITSDETEIQKMKQGFTTNETEIQKLKLKITSDETEIQRFENEIQKLKLKITADETEIQKLRREIKANETEIQKLKLAETVSTNNATLLNGQIDSLEKQLQSASSTGDLRLSDNQRHLNDRITDLKEQLKTANEKLEKAQNDAKEAAEKVKERADKTLLLRQQELVGAVEAHSQQIEIERSEAKKTLEKSIADVQEKAAKEVAKFKAFAEKWQSVELQNKREIFLRNLKFAYAIVACLVVVQGVEASLFTQLAYKDAGFTEWWVVVVGGILAVGFQGIGLFLTVNRGKKKRTITEGYDDKGKPIFKKTNGVLDMESYYDMSTMQVLCIADFSVNCFVFFQNTNVVDTAIQVSARLALYSALAPLGIYFTSEVMLYILDKREALNQ